MQEINSQSRPFTLAPLPYPINCLEAAVDATTMTVHHDKHHQTYVDNLNKATEGKTETLIDLIKNASGHSAAIRNNAGGHWNHSFYWSILSGEPSDNQIPAGLSKAILDKWGSLEKFKEEFEKAGTGQFGSGWVWLIRTTAGLEIISTPNQDNPLMDSAAKKGWPVLTADVWEHAYYLRYQNKRADYLKNFWKVVNWKKVHQYDQQFS